MSARRKYICPKCGKKTGANILYGMPNWSAVERDVEEGYLVLGGCDWPVDGAERECLSCGHQWRIKRRKPRLTQGELPEGEGMDTASGFILIDPPVGSYSPTEEILSWIDELSRMEARPEVLDAIRQAQMRLDRAQHHED